MIVKLTKQSKAVITLEQLDAAKYIIAACKEDDTAASYAELAVKAIETTYDVGRGDRKIIDCTAMVLPNSRVWGWWGDESQNLDVWIEGSADCGDAFVRFGAYLSDICGLSYDTRSDYAKNRFYTRLAVLYFVMLLKH